MDSTKSPRIRKTSVWIPWDAVGSFEKRITLVPSFKTAEGKIIQGTPSTIVLPGPADPAVASATQLSTAYSDHMDAMKSNSPSTSGLSTTTIRRKFGGNPTAISAPGREVVVEQSMLAGKTPSVDMPATRRRTSPGIMRASAQLPPTR